MYTKRFLFSLCLLAVHLFCFGQSNAWPPLPKALDESRFEDAKELLTDDKDPTFMGVPLIVFFADDLSNSPQVLTFLIENGLNKSSYDLAFINAISRNNIESAKVLLDAGANINATYEEKKAFVYTRERKTISFLIDNKIKLSEPYIFEYAWRNLEVLKVLIDKKVKIPKIPTETANDGLRLAAEEGKLWAVKYFLKNGAKVNSQTPPYDGKEERPHENMLTAALRTALMANAQGGYMGGFAKGVEVPPDITRLLIKKGAKVDLKDGYGRTALHHACGYQRPRSGWRGPIPMGNRQARSAGMHGDPASPTPQHHTWVAEELIRSGAKLNATDKDGNTPLHLAVIGKNKKAIALLLDSGAAIDIKNKEDKTIFDYATNSEIIDLFKSRGLKSEIPKEVLNETLENLIRGYSWYDQDSTILRKLLSDGADVNLWMESSDKQNILMYVFSRFYHEERFPQLNVFFDFNINLNAQDNKGRTILMYASQAYSQQHVGSWAEKRWKPANRKIRNDLIDLLLQKGADIHLKDTNNMSALTIANVEENDYASQVLTAAGAIRDINAEWWYTLYQSWRDDQIIKLQKLADEGADVNNITNIPIFPGWSNRIRKDVTALMHSVQKGKYDLAQALIAMKADPNVKNSEGKTAVHYISGIARDHKGKIVFSNFYAQKYDSNAGKTMLEILMQGGADINAKDNSGKTLYDYCVESGQTELAKMVKALSVKEPGTSSDLHRAL